MRNSDWEESPAAMQDWIEPPRPPGLWSSRLCAAAALACAGLGLAQATLNLSWISPRPGAGSLDLGSWGADLSQVGIAPGSLLLCGLVLAAAWRCLSALARHHQISVPDGRFEAELRTTLESQADQIQRLHVSTLGIERSLLEQQAQSQVLTEARLEAQRGSLEHLRVLVDSLRQELHEPRSENPKEHERWQRLEQSLEQRLSDLESRLGAGLAELEQNLSGELVSASETLAQWLSGERATLGDSLECDPLVDTSPSSAATQPALSAFEAGPCRPNPVEFDELPRVESIEIDSLKIDPGLLESAGAALPVRVAELEEPLFDPLELGTADQEFSPLEREGYESWRSTPPSRRARATTASAARRC